MRFQMPHFPTEFEIPDEWLDEAGFQGFSPTSRFFLSSPEAILVPLTAVEPVARFVAHPKDWRGFDRKRLVSLLKGIMSGAMIQPVPVTEIPFIDLDPSPYRFRVHDGFHRFYASVAAGFEALPTVQ
jgi:hypothetical protein